MKKFITLFLVLLLLPSMPVFALSADKPAEAPDIGFVVDGREIKLTDTPLVVNGRTLLPLRAALVSLGVPDENIGWNGEDKSITVVCNGSTIYLKIGSKTALVSGAPVALDAAPVVYAGNQRTYIPVRFISNAVGKEVVWDSSARTVLIRDTDEYAAVKTLLEGINTAMDDIGRVRMTSTVKLGITSPSSKVSLDLDTKEDIDKKAGLLYSTTEMPLFGRTVSIAAFYKDNSEYIKDISDNWERTSLTAEEFKSLLSEDISLASINTTEVMAASLEKQEGSKNGEYLLTGSLYSQGLAHKLGSQLNISGLVPEVYRVEASVDKSTNRVVSLHSEFSGKAVSGGTKCDVSAVVDVRYADYNGDFEIETPEGIVI